MIGLVEAVERNRHEHGAKAVDGREGPVEQAGAVLVDTRVHDHHVIDRLDDEAEHAADHEDPEQVEEVQLDEAAVSLGSAERAGFGGLLGLHVPQLALELALGDQRGVDGRGDDDEDEQSNAVIDEVVAKAVEHDLEKAAHDVHGNETVGDLRDVSAPVPEHEHAKGNVADGAHDEHDELENGERHRERDVVALAEELCAVLDERHHDEGHDHEHRCGGYEAVDTVELEDHGDLATLGGCGRFGVHGSPSWRRVWRGAGARGATWGSARGAWHRRVAPSYPEWRGLCPRCAVWRSSPFRPKRGKLFPGGRGLSPRKGLS